MKVVGYARVVPGEGGETAIAHQESRIADYLKANDLTSGGFYAEEMSGDVSLSDRAKLIEAITDCGPGDLILVVRLDRLSSQKKIVAEIFEHCAGRNIKVTAISGPQTPEEMRNSLEVTVQAG
jgi:DNA invertase Pin-like site-specific DNA recombinase